MTTSVESALSRVEGEVMGAEVTFSDYADAFANIAMTRDDGVLVMRLHTGGSSLHWSDDVHADLGRAFHAVSNDRENAVVVLTGTGDTFCVVSAPGAFRFDPSVPPVGLDRIYQEGKDLILSLLDVGVPMIAAVNGPAWIHAELGLLCDVVIASETTTFRDPHFGSGIVPGDGAHLVWPILLGETRGRYFLLTGQELDATQALHAGLVNEVLPTTDVLPRALALAHEIAAQPPLVRRYTRELLTMRMKHAFQQYLPFGLALEGFASGYGVWR
jgi:enoyl-CoA hydratase/carnithine racemase